MSVLLDEGTVVLDDLDFDPKCEVQTPSGQCSGEAAYEMRCVSCDALCGLCCIDHAIYVRVSVRPMTHVLCGCGGPLRELVEVVPL